MLLRSAERGRGEVDQSTARGAVGGQRRDTLSEKPPGGGFRAGKGDKGRVCQ